jgi:crotonobetainyl-CoA:carnitine CoA-transferase CaiB-like acyl-CoA transferase
MGEYVVMNCYSAEDTLADILSVVGTDRGLMERIQITGADPILPSKFLIGTAGAGVIGAAGLAASELWRLRTGLIQDVSLNVRAAAIGMRASLYFRKNSDSSTEPMRANMQAGLSTKEWWSPVSGFYQGKDGAWIQLHCNFPHHAAGVLKILECANERAAVAAAVSTWDIAELEAVCSDAAMAVAMVRSNEEWAKHPQSIAVDGLPLIEIERIGNSPAEPFEDGERPLSGIRALDLTRVIAGPMCGRTLAEHGADVMRVSAAHLPSIETLVMDTGTGKLSTHIDLRNDAGRETLRTLTRDADIFVQGYRPGGLSAAGFSPEDVATIRPGVIYVTINAYGREGPWSKKRGYDSLVQCCTGLVHEETGDCDIPRHLPAQVLDYVTGYLAASGIMTALARRAEDGGSYHVQLSLCQTAHWLKRLGRISEDVSGISDPSLADVIDLTMQSDSPFGRLRHVAPIVGLSETPPYWARSVVPLGSHEAVWPD